MLFFFQDLDLDQLGAEDYSSDSSSEDEGTKKKPKKKIQKKKRPHVEIEYEKEIDQPSTSKAAKAANF